MARIPLLDLDHATTEQRTTHDQFKTNLTRGLLRTTPAITQGYLALGAGLSGSDLDERVREMVILRVGAISGSAYERMQHIGIAERVGVTDAEVTALESGDYATLGETERATLRYVDELVADPKAPSTFDDALTALGEQDVATVTLLVGHYMMTARFLEALQVDLDDEPADWGGMQ